MDGRWGENISGIRHWNELQCAKKVSISTFTVWRIYKSGYVSERVTDSTHGRLYNISVRIFTRDPTHKHPVRIDGIAVEIIDQNQDEVNLDRLGKRVECFMDHSRCSWKCFVEPKDNDVCDLYTSRSFSILYHGDRVVLNSGVIFHLLVDDVDGPKGGIDASNPASDYQDVHLEFSLGFTANSEATDMDELLPVQIRSLRIQDIFLQNTLKFGGVYSSTLDLIFSQATSGYVYKRIPESDNVLSQVSPKKSFIWSWMTRKFGINSVVEPKDLECMVKLEKEHCRLNDFPIPVLRLENSLDQLITLQHTIYQLVFELSINSDQIMSTCYVYEQVYRVLYQSEIQLNQGRKISISIRQEMYTEITQIFKKWMEGCYDPKLAVRKIEDVIECLADLVRLELN